MVFCSDGLLCELVDLTGLVASAVVDVRDKGLLLLSRPSSVTPALGEKQMQLIEGQTETSSGQHGCN